MTKILNEIRQHGALFSSQGSGEERIKIAVPAGEVFQSCRLTILETRFGADAMIASVPASGSTGDLEAVVGWECEGSGMVRYQLEAFSRPQSAFPEAHEKPVTSQSTGFLPHLHGFHFNNTFESVPSLKLIGDLRYGDASKGLCGGMVYAALDYFIAGLDIPVIPNKDLSPRYGSPLHGPVFDYIGRRLFNSFDIPGGVWSYIELMHPNYPDFQARRGKLSLAPRSRAWHMVRQEWPAIKAQLDAGHPCPLGLICIKSTDLMRLGENHQVLAYGYDVAGDELTLNIYDPNFHDNDDITLKVSLADPEQKTPVTYSGPQKVNCFFHTRYTFSMPPENADIPGRIILFEDEKFCGRSIDVVHANPDLSALKEGNFDDRTSSFVILSGNWNFYRKTGYEDPFSQRGAPLVLGPGNYERATDTGIQDDQLSSLQEVAHSPGN